MFKPIVIVCFIALFASPATAQAPEVEWEFILESEGIDNVYNIYKTNDGGYIVGGYTHRWNAGNQDAIFIKLDSEGDTVWTKTIGLSDQAENIYDFKPTSDSGFIATGVYSNNPYSSNFYLLKVSQECDYQWHYNFGDPDRTQFSYSVTEALDSGYVITGFNPCENVGRQIAVINTIPPYGDILWETFYGLEGSDVGNSIIAVNDDIGSGYVVAGCLVIDWIENLYLMRTNIFGVSLWYHAYGGDQDDSGNKVIQTSDGGYAVVGYNTSYNSRNDKDWFIVRSDTSGQSLWQSYYGSTGQDMAYDIKELPNNSGFIVAGILASGYTYKAGLMRLNADGDSLWTATVGDNSFNYAFAVELTDDGGYIIAGTSDFGNPRYSDIYVVKFGPDQVGINEPEMVLPNEIKLVSNYPNPFNANTQISYQLEKESNVTIKIYDITGRLICDLVNSKKPAGYHSVTWNAEVMPSGVYIYKIATDTYTESNKMVLLK